MNEQRLAAFKIERRTLAAAVFVGERLEYADLRQLASDPQRSESSAIGFVQWIIEAFHVESVAMERTDSGGPSRRGFLTQMIGGSLHADGIAVWQVQKKDLLSAYGIPPLRTRRELRTIVHNFWPVMPAANIHGSTLDAAALGLYVQIRRLLTN